MGKIVLRGFVLFLMVLVLLAVSWTWLSLRWSYSDGERAGYVQKFSRKGWLCKTWEGEVAMVTMPGAIPDKFYFSVRDDAIAAKLNELAGRRLVLHYTQHKFVPTDCFAETEYFVDSVHAVDDTLLTPTMPPIAPQGPAMTAPQGIPTLPQQQTMPQSPMISQPPASVPSAPQVPAGAPPYRGY